MNRRSFLSMLGLAVASEAIPFNRVWSFPSKIRLATYEETAQLTNLAYQFAIPITSAAVAQLAQIYYNPKVIARFNSCDSLIEKYCESTQIPS